MLRNHSTAWSRHGMHSGCSLLLPCPSLHACHSLSSLSLLISHQRAANCRQLSTAPNIAAHAIKAQAAADQYDATRIQARYRVECTWCAATRTHCTGARGPRTCPQAAWHVHWQHRAARPASLGACCSVPPRQTSSCRCTRCSTTALTRCKPVLQRWCRYDGAWSTQIAPGCPRCTHPQVELDVGTGWVTVTDNGRGIPTDVHPSTGKSALETVLTVLHAGGKVCGASSDGIHNSVCQQFGGDSSGYSVSGGLHGVGISVVNALSQELHVSVFRRGRQYSQRYSQGKPLTPLMDNPDHEARVGTRVSFLYDSTIFSKRYVNFETQTSTTCSCHAHIAENSAHCTHCNTLHTVRHLTPIHCRPGCGSLPFCTRLRISTCG